MLKLLILFIFISIGYINGQQKQFINFLPYQNGCYNSPYGVGHSFSLNTCLTNIGLNKSETIQSWYFYVDSDSSSSSDEQYSSSSSSSSGLSYSANLYNNSDCSDSIISTLNFGNENTCTFNDAFEQINGKYQGSDSINYFITITNNSPQYPDNSNTFAFYEIDSSNKCTNENFLHSTSITDNTTIYYFNDNSNSFNVETYNCINSKPILTFCSDEDSNGSGGAKCIQSDISSSCSPSLLLPSFNQYTFCSK